MTRRWAAAVLTGCLVAAGCHHDSGSTIPKGAKAPQTSDTQLLDNPCVYTSVDAVRSIFGGPVGASLVGASCAYRIGDSGEVRFTLRRGDSRPIGQTLAGSELLAQLGDEARWAPVATGHGGVLIVRTGPDTLQFDVLLTGPVGRSEALAVAWARQVIAQRATLVSKSPTTTTAIGPAVTTTTTPFSACALLSQSQRLETLGKGSTIVSKDATTCVYHSNRGADVTVGPLTTPATAQDLLAVKHIVTVNGKNTEWPIAPVKDVGDAAITLTDPHAAGNLELWALRGSQLLRVTVQASDGGTARGLATDVARAVFATN